MNFFYDSLWEVPAKIKNSIIIKEYFEGGLRMVNLVAFIDSMTMMSIKRLAITPGKWRKSVQNFFRHKWYF